MSGSRGRPRDPACDRAIHEAALHEFARRGYEGASMQEVARRACVGKDTLYRRYSTKEELAVDVVGALAADAVRPAPLEVDPYFNLFVYLKDVVRLNRRTEFGALIAGLVGASARNRALARSFTTFWAHRRKIAAPLVRDVVGPDLTEHHVEIVLDRLFGPIYYRLLLTGDDVTDEYLWQLLISATAEPVPPTQDDPHARPST